MTTFRSLALALVNATVLLVALCLFLVLLITNSAERAADRFSEAVSSLAPVRTGVADIREAVRDLRSDIKTLTDRPGTITDDRAEALNAQIAALSVKLEAVNTQLANLGDLPDQVVTTAVDRVADRVTDGIAGYRNCTPPTNSGET